MYQRGKGASHEQAFLDCSDAATEEGRGGVVSGSVTHRGDLRRKFDEGRERAAMAWLRPRAAPREHRRDRDCFRGAAFPFISPSRYARTMHASARAQEGRGRFGSRNTNDSKPRRGSDSCTVAPRGKVETRCSRVRTQKREGGLASDVSPSVPFVVLHRSSMTAPPVVIRGGEGWRCPS